MKTTPELAGKQCEPCSKETPALKGESVQRLRQELGAGWEVMDEHHLQKEYSFRNFQEALDFTNRIGAIAEEQGHHPDIQLSWGKVVVQIWTHAVDGLSENDFILAAKADTAL